MNPDVFPAGVPEQTDIEELRVRLAEAEETLRAIRHGEVDALLISDPSGARLYTLQSADAPYRALVERMQEGAILLTTDGHISYCNRRFAELAQTPMEQIIGASIDQFVDEPDRETVQQLVAIGAGKLRTSFRHGDGDPVDVQVSVSSLTLDLVEHRALIVTDLTTLAKAQRESRSKDEFLAMLAHELRNPLAAIASATQVLVMTDLRESPAIRAREIILRQVSHMARLVDDLLDVGRVVTGKIALTRRQLDLGESVRAYVTAITSDELTRGRIEVVTESVWVDADAVRLEQIVGNLLGNALKFSEVDGHIRVSVTAEGDEAVLRVSDTGTGIDPDLLPRIFDLFVQGEDAGEAAKGGLGIGLTLVRRLAELHGGKVEASSPGIGGGAMFAVRLPVSAPGR